MVTVRQLAGRVPARWASATHHAFLDGVRDGTLPAAAFERWLAQDALFVETLARVWARLLVAAPTPDLPLLADGIAAFVAEVGWLANIAEARGLPAPATPLPATAAYCSHLRAVVDEPYPVALAAMWAVEAAYLEAWLTARPGAPVYRDFVAHWTDDAFAAFVARVEAAADEALAQAAPGQVEAAFDAILSTAAHEAAFWGMTWMA